MSIIITLETVHLVGYWPEYGHTQSGNGDTATTGDMARTGDNDTATTDPLLQHLPLIIGVPVGLGLAGIGVLACIIWLLCSAYFQSRQKYYTSGGGSHSMVSLCSYCHHYRL